MTDNNGDSKGYGFVKVCGSLVYDADEGGVRGLLAALACVASGDRTCVSLLLLLCSHLFVCHAGAERVAFSCKRAFRRGVLRARSMCPCLLTRASLLVSCCVCVDRSCYLPTTTTRRFPTGSPVYTAAVHTILKYNLFVSFRCVFILFQMGSAEDGYKAIKALNGIEIQG